LKSVLSEPIGTIEGRSKTIHVRKSETDRKRVREDDTEKVESII